MHLSVSSFIWLFEKQLHDDGRSTSRNVASLNIPVHGFYNIFCIMSKHKRCVIICVTSKGNYRSSHRSCSVKNGVVKNFTKFTGKHLQVCNFIKKETLPQMFWSEFCEFFKKTFFIEHLRTSASVTSLHYIKNMSQMTVFNKSGRRIGLCGALDSIFSMCYGRTPLLFFAFSRLNNSIECFMELNQDHMNRRSARNFLDWEDFLNMGTSINVSCTADKKKGPEGKILFFLLS